MNEEIFQSRLSRIATRWTVLAETRHGSERGALSARTELFQRYQGAAFRYLLGAVRDSDAAGDLFQEFALRFIRGDFRRADPERGRFRDYLKTALYFLAADHLRQQHRRPCSLEAPAVDKFVEPAAPVDDDATFVDSRRDGLLARAWAALAAVEQNEGQPYFTVLKFRTENPQVRSAEMARQLTARLRPPRSYSGPGIRKTLQRARARFADLLVEDIAFSLGKATSDAIEEELIDLGLLAHCRSALARRTADGQRLAEAGQH